MNREIKFRGQKTSTNEWVYGSPICGKNDNVVAICQQIENPVHDGVIRGWVFGVIPETVGQFTGLHDKNGKEIYEGDVLKCLVGSKSRTNDLYTIIYRLGCPSMDNGSTETPVSFATIHDQLWTNLDYDTKINLCLEITGNIHDK